MACPAWVRAPISKQGQATCLSETVPYYGKGGGIDLFLGFDCFTTSFRWEASGQARYGCRDKKEGL